MNINNRSISVNDLPVGPAPTQIPQVQDIAGIVGNAAVVVGVGLLATTDPQVFPHELGREPLISHYSYTRGTDGAGGAGTLLPAGLVTVDVDDTNITVTLASANDGGVILSFLLI